MRSGLIRRAKQALVVKKRWLDNILDGEELRRAGKAMQFSPEQEPEHQALQRADSGASQLAVAAHAGEASGEEASGERRGADAQEDGRWHHISPVVEQAEADGGGKRQREM